MLAGCADVKTQGANSAAATQVRAIDLHSDNLILEVSRGSAAALLNITPDMWTPVVPPYDKVLGEQLVFSFSAGAAERGSVTAIEVIFIDFGHAYPVENFTIRG